MGDENPTIRISGYLEKKGKMRMMSTWKRYWFVLEGRLLLYYRSKDEYDAISPCKGSINLGPPCSVKSYPSMSSCVFQLETRNSTITLRAENSEEQKLWMQSIMTALKQNQSVKLDSKKQLKYFRYSLSYLIPKSEPNKTPSKQLLERQNTLPSDCLKSSPTMDNQEIINRLRRIGAQSYGGSLNAITKFTKSPSQHSLKIDDKKKSNSSNNLMKKEQHIYECVSNSTNRLDNLMIDNDNYSLPLKKRYSSNNSNDNIIIDNTQYCGIIDDNTKDNNECVYEEVPVDYNKNSVIVDNNFYCKSVVDTENEYEDLDKYRNNNNNDDKKQKKKKSCKKVSIFYDNNNDDKNNKGKDLKKSKSFLQKVWKKRNRRQTKSANDKDNDIDNNDDIYEDVDKIVIEKTDIPDSSTVQILSELHHILENKKPSILNKKLSLEHTNKSEECPETVPLLPPKENKFNNIADTVRSIDEILKDLSDEHKQSKTKVKRLIDKFNSDKINNNNNNSNNNNNNDTEETDGDIVELRNNSRQSTKPPQRYSNDLNQLLDELAKVTIAPIMTPGASISLINSNITDYELLKLLPIRKRRLSEPDYDIPRSHRSIQTLSKREDDNLQATRFFGPILDNNSSNKDDCVYSSMTPDSLEIDDSDNKTHLHLEGSYTSHNYHHNDNNDNTVLNGTSNCNNNDNDEIIYSSPKSLSSVINTCHSVCNQYEDNDNTITYRNINIEDEVFVDSLENYSESYTKF